MKKRVKSFVMALLMLITAFSGIVVNQLPVLADEGPVIRFHFHRGDDNYSGWSVWMWEDGKDGADYELKDENGEMITTMNVTPGATQVGFIVRTQEWEKDFDGDQYIDISEMVSGTVDIYVESGEEGYKKEYGDDAVIGTKLKSTIYNGNGTVTATMTGKIEGDAKKAFVIEGKEGKVEISKVEEKDNFDYLITLKKDLDPVKHYKITYDGTIYDVMMPIIYSTEEFEAAYTYDGNDLGATWTKDKTTFKVWAPTAESVVLNLYDDGTPNMGNKIDEIEMKADDKGTWVVEKEGDLNGTYYTYSVTVDGEKHEACDPYARTTGVNGERAMVIDLASTDPEGWDKDTNPHAGETINDAVIYELHIRDLSTDASSGIENKGKFLGLTETGTKNSKGVSTGLDHIKELGATHVHVLPFYDFGSVNEMYKYKNPFNWGYDPMNYNVPEGSYSTDPTKGEVRVNEAKQMVKALHDNDVSIIMDVVYNHVYNASSFCFNNIVPGYFSRVNNDGTYSNGSGCGNDTASERSMVKKFIVDSVKYWADEYHIDGFRFDLVGLIDIDTINAIVEEVHKDHPDVIFYGEGWTMNTELTKENVLLATQGNSEKTPDFAYFSDNIRDTLKGNVFSLNDIGFISGAIGKEKDLEDSFMAKMPWCKSPSQTINYVSCHDNLTLYDKLKASKPEADEADIIRMNNLAAAIYMTAQGVPFMQAGEEMLRSKPNDDGTYNSNSYCSGDEVNSLKWDDLNKDEYKAVFEYYKGLIKFRKAHNALRLTNAQDVEKSMSAIADLEKNVVGFDVKGDVNNESADEILMFFNANTDPVDVNIPEGKWNVYINGEKAGVDIIDTISAGTASIDKLSALVLVKEGKSASALSGFVNNYMSVIMTILVGICAILAALIFLKYKKRHI